MKVNRYSVLYTKSPLINKFMSVPYTSQVIVHSSNEYARQKLRIKVTGWKNEKFVILRVTFWTVVLEKIDFKRALT
jgi:hypothetical protein